MAKVLVTGGAGFIGSRLVRRLVSESHQVKVIDNLVLGREAHLEGVNCEFVRGDLRNLATVEDVMRGQNVVFHLAANSDISQGAARSDVDLENGTVATWNVLEAMRRCGVRDIVFASTSAVYGEAAVKPTPEGYGPLLPISFYGASKLACEALISAFAHNCGMRGLVFRFANVVGRPATHGAIYDFTKRLMAEPTKLSVLGNGTQKKSYLHVEDCVDAMMFGWRSILAQAPAGSAEIFNLASEGVTQVRDIAECVVDEVAKALSAAGRARIEFGEGDRGWVGDVPFTWLDGSKLLALGWRPAFNSGDAVRRAVREVVEDFVSTPRKGG
ncbi:MAG TPA: NAD-dependent epimerase/dehydratase family protein [Pseudobdellovibrionaceae bacterium]|nr:NAD-dependent epimerase/dehydratase family protein [Pseudobdellovibrionaceae bacterium]